MKIYNVTSQSDREWFSTKRDALSCVKELKADWSASYEPIAMEVVELNLTRQGVVELLNKVAVSVNPAAAGGVTDAPGATRVTANKPPVPMSEEDINKVEAWGLGELAKKCPATKKFLATKKAEEAVGRE